MQVESSVFFGVLTPLRNNQTDVTNPAYTGAVRGIECPAHPARIRHRVHAGGLAADAVQDRGFDWASWQGDSDDPRSTLGPAQAPQIPFAWHNGGPAYVKTMDPVEALPGLLTGPQGAGAGKIGMTTAQWLRVAN